jgi:hypothetical protein
MQLAHDADGLDVDGVVIGKLVLRVSGDEGKKMDVLVEFREWKLNGDGAACIEERKDALIVRLKVVQGNAGEIRDNNVTGNLVHAAIAGEVLNIAEGLGLRLAEVSAAAFVLDQDFAGPEEVNETVLAGDFVNRLLKGGHEAALDAEDLEKLIPKGLLFSLFAFDSRPCVGKSDSTMADFIP